VSKIEDLYNKHAVKIICNGLEGSGCIVQPSCSDYSYIFTAKHCLIKDEALDKGLIQILRFNDKVASTIIQDIYLHSDFDIAIIKVNKISEFFESRIFQPVKGESVSIYGYPSLLKAKSEQRQNINCKVSFHRDSYFEITSENPQFTFDKSMPETIKGFSGSGVFYEQGDNLFISGILTKLKAFDGGYSSLCAIDISIYEELIKKYELATIFSDNLSNISKDYSLINNVFAISYNSQSAPYYQERVIDSTFLNYLNNPKNVWISGPSGVGKTLFILRNLNKEKKAPKHIDLTCSQVDNIDEYFEYINNELIRQFELTISSDKASVYDRISDNLCNINDHFKDILIFVDEVPISDKEKFYNFLSGFVNISDRYSNLNRKENKIKWIISTRIDPSNHVKIEESCHSNKAKVQKNFIFKNIDLWTDDDLSSLLNLLQRTLDFSLSIKTKNEIIKISKGLPGRLKNTIERVLLENCTIHEAIEIIKSENN